MFGKNSKPKEMRGVGMFDDEAGATLRSDPQLVNEVMRTVSQALSLTPDADLETYRVLVHASDGVVRMKGKLPDLGTRRMVILAVQALDAVRSVEADDLIV